MTTPRLVIGCMSGTSMDGIDAAAVRIEGSGRAMRCTFVAGASAPLPHAEALRAFANGSSLSARSLASIGRDLGEAHKSLITKIVSQRSPDLIVMHGQTVLHDPPLSWQLLDPWPVASAFHCRVVTDLRSRSIAMGGQGAPLTPLADWILFRDDTESRCVVNLGGFANLTILPAASVADDSSYERVRGGDVCPCNLVLDRLARDRLGTAYDDRGREALGGSVDHRLADDLARRFASLAGRSLGTGDEAGFVDDAVRALAARDALATVCEAIARAIRAAAGGDMLVLAGGGVHNGALVRCLQAQQGSRLRTSDQLGIPVQFREAVAFGVLGALAENDVCVTLPQITGATTSGRDGQWILP
ncbi:MAG: anhydro-N-acetylmuramic acid kinase [Planctomycetota bacterium]